MCPYLAVFDEKAVSLWRNKKWIRDNRQYDTERDS